MVTIISYILEGISKKKDEDKERVTREYPNKSLEDTFRDKLSSADMRNPNHHLLQ